MTTATVNVGSSKDLDFTFKDRDGTLTNPTSIALTIRQPDGTEIAKTKTDMTEVSTGVWRYVFAVTQEGRHFARADGDGAVEAAVAVEFYALRKTTS
jgi:hypothetical protein